MSTNNVAPWIASFEFDHPFDHGTEGGGVKVHPIVVTVDMYKIAKQLGTRAIRNSKGKATSTYGAVQVRTIGPGAGVRVLDATTT